MHAGLEVTVADSRVFGIAGDKQDFQPGTGHQRGVGDLPAVHPARQADVGYQQVDPQVRLQDLQSGGPVFRLQYLIAGKVENFSEHHPNGLFVVDHQNHLAGALRDRRWQHLGIVRREFAMEPREVQAHRRAFAHLRINPDLSAGLARKAVHHRQAESGALSQGFGGEKWIESQRHDVWRHAAASICHAQRDVLPGRHVALFGRLVVEPLVRGFDREPPARWKHCVARVDAQVEQRVFKLRRVNVDRPQPDGALHFDMDLGSNSPANQLFHACHQPVCAQRLGIERLAPGKRQQPLCQRCSTFDRALRHRHVLAERVVMAERHSPRQHLQADGNRIEQVVEIMRDAAGQLTHSLHLLGLAKCRLGLEQFALARLVVGQIAADRNELSAVRFR